MSRKTPFVIFFAVALLRGAPALAQAGDVPDPSTVRVRIGPLMMNPTIAISNVGIDHNVFNDPPDRAPKEDFTFTLTPRSDFWLPAGPTWITGTLNESINWYQKYSSERAANNSYKLGWQVPGSRMTLKVDGEYVNAKERPGFEIDTRAGRTETTFNGAFDVHALSKSSIGLSASRSQMRFADDAEFLGTSLRTSLNRVETTYGVNLRQQLTSLTSVTITGSHSMERFDLSPGRNTSSNTLNATAGFAPAALIRGSLSIGYTDFTPADPTLPGYRGMVANVDLTYVLLGSTRFAVTATRGVNYSYDVSQPYYLQSRIGGSVAQQIFGPFDVQLRGDVAYLDYRNRAGADVQVPDRSDRVTTIGVGLGLHMGKDLRLSFNVDQNNRDTRVAEHQYEKFLLGTALTYGF